MLAAVAIGAFVILRKPSGPLLARGDAGVARAHLALRETLAALDAEAAAAPGTAADESADAAKQRVATAGRAAMLRSRLRKSRFTRLSDAELARAIRLAEDGHYVSDDAIKSRAVYGSDDRQDMRTVTSLLTKETDPEEKLFLQRALAQTSAVGAWIRAKDLIPDGEEFWISSKSLADTFDLCPGEAFAKQPSAALGTAFLIAADTVVTANHILSEVPLSELRLVFDFEVTQTNEPRQVRRVFRPAKVLHRSASDHRYDWAVIRLEEPVKNAVVLTLAPSDDVPEKDPVYMWGHSAGTPKKFTRGDVTVGSSDANYLRVNLDAFGGDSGSPVLNESHQVVGVFCRGREDFRLEGGCHVAAVISTGTAEWVTHVQAFRKFVNSRQR